MHEKIIEISQDSQEAGMIKEALEREDKPRCRFCLQPMEESEDSDAFLECKRDRLVISKRFFR